jgi:hypothetical protein
VYDVHDVYDGGSIAAILVVKSCDELFKSQTAACRAAESVVPVNTTSALLLRVSS